MARTLVVLGAGASRGAAFSRRAPPDCLPPLNADFFSQLQKISARKFQAIVPQVINDVVQLHGSNFSLTLEDYFTELEFARRVAPLAATDEQREAKSIDKKYDNLMHALHAALESSTNRLISAKDGCRRHQALVDALTAGDTIISFNYDCLIDDALRRRGSKKWNAAFGYRFPSRYSVEGADNWNPTRPAATLRQSIRLLKLHGSVNWKIPKTKRRADQSIIQLKERIHSQRGWPRFTIIPPVWNKEPDTDAFEAIWGECAEAIRGADVIAIIGFSFAPTDLFAQSLFRMALRDKHHSGGTKLRRLIIAAPSRETRARIRQIFDVPLQQNDVLVRQYETFSEMELTMASAFD